MNLMRRRILMNRLVMALSGLAAAIGLFFLIWILGYVTVKGVGAINWAFFTQLPSPPGVEGGGLSSAIAGTYLSEFGRDSRLGHTVRFLSDILVSAPSIVIGVFVYLVMVKPLGGFSGLAGAVSLAIIMLPVVTRTTEEMLRLVPGEMREAALALGAPYWHTMVRVVFRAATAGLLTGVLLAVARVSGETAPLLFTALNSPYWGNLNQPMSNLTVTLFNYAMSPYDDWHAKAWGAAFLITASVLIVTILTRFILRDRSKR
jgi:phosphate transport system permease protein